VNPWDAVAALEVLDAARVSASHGEVIRLAPPLALSPFPPPVPDSVNVNLY
jgi:hypothetical protein